MSRFRLPTLVAVLVGLCGAAVVPAAPLAGASTITASPQIIARPNNVMVNTQTQLTGSNFKPRTTYKVVECSRKSWVVPTNPCDTKNSIGVTTNARGGFKSPFTVETCPATLTPPGFSQICYIGVPKPNGIDTVVLIGAAKITVTGP